MNEFQMALLILITTIGIMVIKAIRDLRKNKNERCTKCLCKRLNHILYFAGCKFHANCEEFEWQEPL